MVTDLVVIGLVVTGFVVTGLNSVGLGLGLVSGLNSMRSGSGLVSGLDSIGLDLCLGSGLNSSPVTLTMSDVFFCSAPSTVSRYSIISLWFITGDSKFGRQGTSSLVADTRTKLGLELQFGVMLET